MQTPLADSAHTPLGFSGSGFAIRNFDGKPSLAFYDPSSGMQGAWRLVPIDAALAFFVHTLPPRADGLPPGALWSNNGILSVVL